MRRNGEAGQALVIFALALTVLMLAAGLAVDMGYLRYQKRRMQTAADSAAIAAASELSYGDSPIAAQNDAQLNGFDVAAANVTTSCPLSTPSGSDPIMWVQSVTALGSGSSATCSTSQPCVQVEISQNQPTFFMRIAGIKSEPVSASAMARLGPGSGCMYALGSGGIVPVSTGSIGSMYVQANFCDLMSAGPVDTSGALNASHRLAAAAVGDSTGQCTPGPPQCTISSPPQIIAPPADPLAYLLTSSPPSGPINPILNSCGYTYCAGTYTNPVQITGSGTTTFEPGVYVFQSGLTISGPGTVTGTGVTFYNTSASSPFSIDANADYASCNPNNQLPLNIGGVVQLTAPTDPSNSYAGILFVQTSSPTATLALGNGDDCNATPNPANSSYLWGALYFPQAQLDLIGLGADATNGCSTIARFTLAVANSIQLAGNDNFNTDDCTDPTTLYSFPATWPDPDPIKAAVLVE